MRYKWKMQTYTLDTRKISQPVCLAIASDLHGCAYGEKQRELLDAIDSQKPNAVLMVGDMSDARDDDTPFWEFLTGAAALAPCYYVTGNHEFGRNSRYDCFSEETVKRQKEEIRRMGIHVLEGEKELLCGSGGQVAVMGMDDELVGKGEFNRQYLRCCQMTERGQYTILLSHRPEKLGAYRYFPGDLVVCGHAHGGQWRLWGARGGVYAPGQGLFPRYAGGLYPRGQGFLLVSCGLCYKYPKIPRFGNPPELVILRLNPAGKEQETAKKNSGKKNR